MKLSKVMHGGSVIVGLIGLILFLIAVLGNSESTFGITKMDTLACVAILILIAIWLTISTIHHVMLEKTGEIV